MAKDTSDVAVHPHVVCMRLSNVTFSEIVLAPNDGSAKAFTTMTTDGYGTSRIEIREKHGYHYLWVQSITSARTDPGGKVYPQERCYPLDKVLFFNELA